MNIQPNITHTAAEEALLAALKGSERPAAAKARQIIGENGLPTRRVEAWHYTDLRSMLRDFPGTPSAIQSEFSREDIVDLPELVESFTLGFSNTYHVEGSVRDLPEGMSGTVGTPQGDDRLAVEIADDTIGLINAGLSENGARIAVAQGAKVATPLTLAHAASGATTSALTHNVEIGENASAMVIERHTSGLETNHQNMVCNLTLAKGARAVWAIVQELGNDTTRLAQLNVALAEAAELTILILNAGGRLVRQEVHVAVAGEHSRLTIKGVNLIGEGAHTDVTTTLAHNVPDTLSTELFRNVVTAKGRGAFQGQIRVAQKAQKTDARMACNTLLLSDEADFSAKPELEIFADDVICAHGATVTDIDEDHLFYLRSRGIGEKSARTLLVKAFVEEVFEELETADLASGALGNALISRIETWLDAHG